MRENVPFQSTRRAHFLSVRFQAKDKLSSLAPAPVEDAAFDGDGNRLPRVFVPRNGDIFHADTKVVGTSASGMQVCLYSAPAAMHA